MTPMKHHFRAIGMPVCGVLLAGVALFAADYTLTVNHDRLVNAQNEPQNWLLMNGDYGATRYSKLTQINRDNVKNLRMVWALALGGMQDVGQNGPENEVNPLIDNGFMYTTRRLGHGLQDRRAQSRLAEVRVGVRSRACKHEGNAPRTRGIALWEDKVRRQPAGRPRHRDQPRQRRDRLGQEDRRQERVRRPGEIPDGAARRRRQGHHPERRGRRRHARLGRGARRQDRQRAVALVYRAEARRSRQRDRGKTITTPGRRAAAASGRPAPTIRRRSSTSSAPAIRIRFTTRSSGRATTSTRTRWSRSTSRPASSPGTSSTRRTIRGTSTRVGVHMLYDTTIDGAEAQGRRPLRAQRVLLLARSDERQIHQGREVRQRFELDEGDRSEDRQAGRVQREVRRADSTTRKRARCAATA